MAVTDISNFELLKCIKIFILLESMVIITLPEVRGCTGDTLPVVMTSGQFRMVSVASHTLCVRLCWYFESCRSISWDAGSKHCQLNMDTIDSNPDAFASNRAYQYSDMLSTPCGMATHPCGTRPCSDSQVCITTRAGKSRVCVLKGLEAAWPESVPDFATETLPETTSGATTASTTAATTNSATTYSTTTSVATTTKNTTTTTITSTITTETTSSTTATPTTTTKTTITTTVAATTPLATTTTTTTSTDITTTTTTTTPTTSSNTTTITTTTTTALPATTKPLNPCITSCEGLASGSYQSCSTCSGYISCSNGFLSNMPCTATLIWNDNIKNCAFPPSPTCTP